MSLPFETANFAALKKLASQVFGRIKAAEDRVLQVSASTEENDKAQPEGNPEIRAEFLCWLVTEKAASPTSSIREQRLSLRAERLFAGHQVTRPSFQAIAY
jgi:hypothetical protein